MRAGETALTPIGSRKGSPVQNRPVRDSPLRVAGDAESQFFACARYVRRTFPYRLTCDLVANLRLLFVSAAQRFHCAWPIAVNLRTAACMHVQAKPVGRSAQRQKPDRRTHSAHERPDPAWPVRVLMPIATRFRQPGRALYSAPSSQTPENSHPRSARPWWPICGERPSRAGSTVCTSCKPSPYRQKRRESRHSDDSRKTSP